ncbi:MAG: hypothetical protein JRH18_22510 [Deltaproteobacteria bacterium]|nr:hypothetical protein [Deltaproteobacteria bacterium]
MRDEDYLGSVAFDLHSFYQGVERIFEAIAKSIDRTVPSGDRWHKSLLAQMTEEIPGKQSKLDQPNKHSDLEGT